MEAQPRRGELLEILGIREERKYFFQSLRQPLFGMDLLRRIFQRRLDEFVEEVESRKDPRNSHKPNMEDGRGAAFKAARAAR